MRYRYSVYLGFLVFLVDLILLNLSLGAAWLIRGKGLSTFLEGNDLALLICANLMLIGVSLVRKQYRLSRATLKRRVLYRSLEFIVIQLILVAAVLSLMQGYIFDRTDLLLAYGLFFIGIANWRIIYIFAIGEYRRSGYNHRSIVIAGKGSLAGELKEYLDLHPEIGYNFCGYFDQNADESCEGSLADLKNFVQTNRIDEIYCCLPSLSYDSTQDLIRFGEQHFINVKLIADFRGFEFNKINLEHFGYLPVLNVTKFPLDAIANRIIKRTFDILFSLAFLVLIFSWLYPLLALIILIDSPGPVLFRQRRHGLRKREFNCLKFRTMRVNSDCDKKQACVNDPRVTRVGRILRQTSLDESPQFINVLLGHMSVVGPRPHMLAHTEEYSVKVDRFMARHYVKPGITGLAQAKGYRGETKELFKMENRVKYDRFYIKKWSILFDLKIIILTTFGLLKTNKNAF